MNSTATGPRYLMRWNFRQSGRIDQDIVTTPHRLGELSLFSDAGLANLIDCYPRTAMVVESETEGSNERRLGTIGNASGHEILTMLSQGNFSIILKDLGQHSGPLRRILIRLNQEMVECSDSMRVFSFSGDLHLTSPGIESPIRCDTDPVVRWQIRGEQTLMNYSTDVIDSHQLVERIVQEDRDVAYRKPLMDAPSTDDSACCLSVEAGTMQSMPQATPHRIIQTDYVGVTQSDRFGVTQSDCFGVTQSDRFGVTLISRYQTPASIQHDDVVLSNHWLRRFQNLSLSRQLEGRHRFARRTIAALVRRKAKQQLPWIDEHSFSLDSLKKPSSKVWSDDPNVGQLQLTH